MRLAARRARRRTFRMAGYLAALCLLLISAGCSATRTPDGAAAAGHGSLRAAYTAARYAVRPVADTQHGAVWDARNSAHALHATFTAAGFDLAVRLPAEDVDVRSTWRLASLGYGTAQQIAAPGELHSAGQRVEVARPGIVEWFVNAPAGLEHGFTLAERPGAGEIGEPLRLVLHVSGDLTPVAEAAGRRISLRDATGNRILTYTGLRVWDAGGTPMPAHMTAAGDRVTINVDDRTARYPLTIDPTFGLEAYLKASNSGAFDQFGYALAVAGDTVVVGAPGEDSNATAIGGDGSNNGAAEAGAAYVFVYSAGVWSEQAYLKAANAEAGDAFGSAVAIAGDTLVVGAPYEDSNANTIDGDGGNNSNGEAGAAYVFVRSGATWTQQAYLKAANSGANDWFGYAVAVDGDTVLVGAPGEASTASGVNGNGADDSAPFAGAAYVFVRSGVTWSQQAYLKASNPQANDDFGWSVALSGESALIGAPFEDSSATGVGGNGADNSAPDAGAAYAFVRSGTAWSQQAYLKASNTGAGDHFGHTVALSGESGVLGAPIESSSATTVNGNGADNNAFSAGAAYVFTRSGTAWSQQAYLKAANAEAYDEFGASVAILGDLVAAGATMEDGGATGVNGNGADNSVPDSGAAYVFLRNGANWAQRDYLKAANRDAGDQFGAAVALAGDRVAIGAPLEDSAGTTINGDGSDNSAEDAGAAYVFGSLIAGDVTIGLSVAPATARPGQTITYTLAFTNNGPDPAVGVAITHELPAGIVFGGIASAGVVVTQTSGAPGLAWVTDPLPAQGRGFITVTGSVDGAITATLLTSTAAITAANEYIPTNNDASANLAIAVPVTVSPAGTGSGTVTSAPAGIACGATCAASFAPNINVVLSATPATGSTFTGWGGACSGSGACTVTTSAARAVTATFTRNRYTLAVTRAGTGSGTVTSAPAGIACGATCAADFDHGTSVTLSATPAAGSSFTGWSGACSGSVCTVSMTAARNVTATFTRNRYRLTVTTAGTGSGTVTSAPAGIACGATCAADFDSGTSVTLSAGPVAGATFAGWSGACAGTGACTVTMDAARSVTATFDADPPATPEPQLYLPAVSK
ncbi:MAG: DUF11 domain-containing protein [Caldilineaceae bacterium]|nr:DUF11 domain-containing protein [Caldilineaceae bacterium]